MAVGLSVLYMTIPDEALPSVMFRATRLQDEGITLASWSVEVADASGDTATLRLTAQEHVTVGDWLFLGHTEKNASGESVFTPAPTFAENLPISDLPGTCTVCSTRRSKYHLAFRRGDEVVHAGFNCLAKAGILANRVKFADFFPAATCDPRIPLDSTAQRVMARPRYDTLECLAAAISDYRHRGYVSRRHASVRGGESSADFIAEIMQQRETHSSVPPQIFDNLLAAAIMRSHLLDIDPADMDDFSARGLKALRRERVLASAFPLVAALPKLYAGGETCSTPTEQRNTNSQWVGVVGERLEIQCTLESVTPIVNSFGEGLTKASFLTQDGSLLVWFTASDISAQPSQVVILRGTVKRHETFRGTKETVMSRCLLRNRG